MWPCMGWPWWGALHTPLLVQALLRLPLHLPFGTHSPICLILFFHSLEQEASIPAMILSSPPSSAFPRQQSRLISPASGQSGLLQTPVPGGPAAGVSISSFYPKEGSRHSCSSSAWLWPKWLFLPPEASRVFLPHVAFAFPLVLLTQMHSIIFFNVLKVQLIFLFFQEASLDSSAWK